ncbi:hypothetical protein RRG08_015740 [Elysia crispata]|uniref:Uncharacterized protein n=1 Tax=Elysia crispata TaxID=231223 RepID=A0AAE0YS57_9GAST|nr:hypothetical protein RRG08_015740 [Elysia crispata]
MSCNCSLVFCSFYDTNVIQVWMYMARDILLTCAWLPIQSGQSDYPYDEATLVKQTTHIVLPIKLPWSQNPAFGYSGYPGQIGYPDKPAQQAAKAIPTSQATQSAASSKTSEDPSDRYRSIRSGRSVYSKATHPIRGVGCGAGGRRAWCQDMTRVMPHYSCSFALSRTGISTQLQTICQW